MSHREYIGEDGTRWPSVTEILNYPPKPWITRWQEKYGKRAVQKTKAAQRIGTHFHFAIQNNGHNCKYKRVNEMFKLWQKWYGKTELTISKTELHVKSKKHKFHGTFDALCIGRLENGKKYLS